MNASSRKVQLPLIAASSGMILLHINVLAWAFGFSLGGGLFLAFVLLSLALVIWRSPVKGVFLMMTVCVFALMILSTPVVAWDARSIWFFHAKRLWHGGDLYAYLDLYAPWSHNDYPPLLATTAATLARSLGRWNEVFPRLSVLLLLVPVTFTFVHVFSGRFVFVAWIASLFAFYVVGGGFGLLSGYMDLVLGLYYAAAVLLMPGNVTGSAAESSAPPPVWQTVSFLMTVSILPMIKNEGLVGAVIILAIFLFFQRQRPLMWLFALAALLPWLLVWKLPLMASGVTGEFLSDGAGRRLLARLLDGTSIFMIARGLLSNAWPTLLAFLVVFGVLNWQRPRGSLVALLFFAVYMAVLGAAYLITPYDLAWHLATSSSRVVAAAGCVLFCQMFSDLEAAHSKLGKPQQYSPVK